MTKGPAITTLADLMPAYDEERRLEIEKAETPEKIAAREAKLKAEIEREIRQGLRDANGDWIISDDEIEPDDDDEDDE